MLLDMRTYFPRGVVFSPLPTIGKALHAVLQTHKGRPVGGS